MPSLGNEATVAGTEVWLTPPYILEALGAFDLDPCASLDRPGLLPPGVIGERYLSKGLLLRRLLQLL